MGVLPGSLFAIHKPRGGIYYPQPHASASSLTFTEREEISHGIAVGRSIRCIAASLSRSPATISRETNRNKGRKKYRALDADDRAARRGHDRRS
ncbi:helix-turn-helix domain-containing protein [Paramicrobacterium fandaimingii]|uniref:helix-turn-helix domain-containing protein n=1 Tax=Paramicrobacterium fandaimingii TaxID=2708079 RepID=UPI00142168A0